MGKRKRTCELLSGFAKITLYPVDGVKLACWVVRVFEQSKLYWTATMA